jgi:hypothetical protein
MVLPPVLIKKRLLWLVTESISGCFRIINRGVALMNKVPTDALCRNIIMQGGANSIKWCTKQPTQPKKNLLEKNQ